MTENPPSQQPLLRVVQGDPTPEELAALVAVVSARSAAAAAAAAAKPEPKRSAWAARDALVRRPLRHGPNAWKHSARPR